MISRAHLHFGFQGGLTPCFVCLLQLNPAQTYINHAVVPCASTLAERNAFGALKHRQTQSQQSNDFGANSTPLGRNATYFLGKSVQFAKASASIVLKRFKMCKSVGIKRGHVMLWCWQTISSYVSQEKLNRYQRCFESTPP